MANRLKKSELAAATASVANDKNEHVIDDAVVESNAVAAEIAALEREAENDPTMKAAGELLKFRLTPGAQSLLDRAMDNIAQNTGAGLPDEDAKLQVRMRAALVDAAGNDLSIVLGALVDSCDQPKEIAPSIYSMCFNVLKSAGFIANLDYRRYLDPRGDFDLTPYVLRNEHGTEQGKTVEHEALGTDFEADQRSEHTDPPLGLEDLIERERQFFAENYGAADPTEQLRFMSELYGRSCEDIEDVFACSLEDLRLFLQLTCESFGWEPENVMPYAFIMETNGSFTPINDAALALDHYEIKRKESQARRRQADAARLATAAEKARAAVTAALARK